MQRYGSPTLQAKGRERGSERFNEDRLPEYFDAAIVLPLKRGGRNSCDPIVTGLDFLSGTHSSFESSHFICQSILFLSHAHTLTHLSSCSVFFLPTLLLRAEPGINQACPPSIRYNTHNIAGPRSFFYFDSETGEIFGQVSISVVSISRERTVI